MHVNTNMNIIKKKYIYINDRWAVGAIAMIVIDGDDNNDDDDILVNVQFSFAL